MHTYSTIGYSTIVLLLYIHYVYANHIVVLYSISGLAKASGEKLMSKSPQAVSRAVGVEMFRLNPWESDIAMACAFQKYLDT